MSDRGMKKWAPFKALKEQDSTLERIMRDKHKIAMPELSDEDKEEIVAIINGLQKGDTISIEYYEDGFVNTLSDTYKWCDEYGTSLICKARRYALNQVVSIKHTGYDEDF